MSDPVEEAYRSISSNLSADRVVADPELNSKFIEHCRSMGLIQSAAELNRRLLNLRKQGALKPAGRTRPTRLTNAEDYKFAAEIAARHMEQRRQTTLDRVLCDPELAVEFDAIASELAPGYASLEYRWAALQLRKTSKLKPELVLRVTRIAAADFGPIEQVHIDRIPDAQGIYIFYSAKETLYVGEAENLRKRVGKHVDHSDRKALAHWFWEHGAANVRLETIVLPKDFSALARKAVEKHLIASRRPLFNIQR